MNKRLSLAVVLAPALILSVGLAQPHAARHHRDQCPLTGTTWPAVTDRSRPSARSCRDLGRSPLRRPFPTRQSSSAVMMRAVHIAPRNACPEGSYGQRWSCLLHP
jgi:hypothetical protein